MEFSKKLAANASILRWASNSKHILCVVKKKSLVVVFDTSNKKYCCKIANGIAGVSNARFSPDSKFVLVWSHFNLRITIWSLTDPSDKAVGHIQFPKFSTKGCEFSKDGKYLALLERKNCKDYVDLFVTDTWELVKQFPCQTKDASNLKWSPSSRLIVVWDDSTEYKVNLFTPDGTMLNSFSAYEGALGIRSVRWCPHSQLVAVGSYDQKLRILSKHTWKPLVRVAHKKKVKTGGTVFSEIEYSASAGMMTMNANLLGAQNNTKYLIQDFPVDLSLFKSRRVYDINKPNPRKGVFHVSWSHDGQYFCSREDMFPNVLWIWSTSKLSLIALIVQLNAIRSVKWDPKHTRLALCSGNGKIYMWQETMCACIDLGLPNFRVYNLKWSCDGDSMLLYDESSNKLSVCYPLLDEDEEIEGEGESLLIGEEEEDDLGEKKKKEMKERDISKSIFDEL